MINCFFEDGKQTSLRHVVVEALIEKDNKLLFVKRAPGMLEGGKWAIVSGFLDRDETTAEGVIREVKEETGWDCAITHLFRINSRPGRPNDRERQNVAIEYILKPLKKTGRPDRETTDIMWVEIEKIDQMGELAFDHSQTVQLYLTHRNNPSDFPLTD